MSVIPKALEGWYVLIVDDEPDNLDVARRMLEKAGAHVLMAENGAEALNIINHQHVDFVLCDLSMPVMDGWMLIEELNQDRRLAELPVIALTAHAMNGDRERAIQAGFVNYITKPLDIEKFVTNLLAILVDIPVFSKRLGAE